MEVYATALREATSGTDVVLRLVDPDGVRPPILVSPADWVAAHRPGDNALLDRCHGLTLDAGCGPGRLATALTRRNVPALGVDISRTAVRLARRRGARARVACILCARLGRWRHVLLADGNIGIGGDPERLLRRCHDLLADGGDILIELEPPGARTWTGQVSLDGVSEPFAWATIGVDDIAELAAAAGFTVREIWTEAGRWFASVYAL